MQALQTQTNDRYHHSAMQCETKKNDFEFMAGHLINLFLSVDCSSCVRWNGRGSNDSCRRKQKKMLHLQRRPESQKASEKHKFTRSAIMPTALQEIGSDCCLIFTRILASRYTTPQTRLVFIIFYGDSEVYSTSIPEGVV